MRQTLLAARAIVPAIQTQPGSYTFSDHGFGASIVTGSFDGTASGNLITGLTNISAFRDGVEFGTGNLNSEPLVGYGRAGAKHLRHIAGRPGVGRRHRPPPQGRVI